jgi:hypothetical protein
MIQSTIFRQLHGSKKYACLKTANLFEGGNMDSFDLTCQWNPDRGYGWGSAGPYPRCVQTCTEIYQEPLNEKELNTGVPVDSVIWHCNKINYPGSVCQKNCGPGYEIKGPKRIKACQCIGGSCHGGPSWKGQTSNCMKIKIRRKGGNRRNFTTVSPTPIE